MTKLFKVGDKVKIPKTKSVGININDPWIRILLKKEKHDYLSVTNIINLNALEQRIECMFPTSKMYTNFLNTDLEHYEEFPKKWVINLYPEVKKWIEDNFKSSKYTDYCESTIFHFPNWENKKGFLEGRHTYFDTRKNYKKITLEQFKKHILKEKQMKKQIIGYKLIKPEYEKEALSIANISKFDFFQHDSLVYKLLKESGVLDLWFEPVYKEDKQIIKMHSSNRGEFEIEVIDGKAYYQPDGKELPKEWIKRIINSYNDILTSYGGSHNPYEIKIASIKVGCMEGTREEDWLKVYKFLK